MALATLSIDIVAQLAKLTADMDKATRLNEKAAAEIERRWSQMSAAAGRIGAGIGAALGSGWAIEFVRSTVDAIDALNDAKDATGSTIESLSALERVARENGGTLDDVTSAIAKLNQGLNSTKADGSDEISRTLKAIGLEAENLKKMDPALALRDVAKAFASSEDDGNKSRAMMTLLGKSMKELAPFMVDLAAKTELVGKDTEETARRADLFNNQLNGIKADLQDAARAIVSDFLPALTEFVRDVRSATDAYGGFLRALKETGPFGSQQFGNKTEGLMHYRDALKAANDELDAQKKKLDESIKSGGFDAGAALRIEKLKEERAQIEKNLKYYQGLVQLNSQAGQGRGNYGMPKFSVDVPEEAKKAKAAKDTISEYERLMQRIKEKLKVEQEEATQGRELSQAQKERLALLGAIEGAQKKLTAAEEKNLKAEVESLFKAQEANDIRKQGEKIRKEVADAQGRAADQWRAEKEAMTDANTALAQQIQEYGLTERAVQSLTLARLDHEIAIRREALAEKQRETRGANLAADKERIDLLEKQRDLLQGLADVQDFKATDVFSGLSDGLKAYMEEVRLAGDFTRTAVEGALKGLEDKLTDFFMTGRADWKSYVEYVLSQLVRISITQPMVNSLAGYFSSLGGQQSFSGVGTSGQSAGSLVGLGLGAADSSYTQKSLYQQPQMPAKEQQPITINATYHVGSQVSHADVKAAVDAGNAKLVKDIRYAQKVGNR